MNEGVPSNALQNSREVGDGGPRVAAAFLDKVKNYLSPTFGARPDIRGPGQVPGTKQRAARLKDVTDFTRRIP